MRDSHITRKEAEIIFRVAEEELAMEAWQKASEALGKQRKRQTIVRDYRLSVVLAERFLKRDSESFRNLSDSEILDITMKVGYGLTRKRVEQFALWYMNWKGSNVKGKTKLGAVKEKIVQELIWPDWKEIPIDLYQRTGPVRLVVGSGEIRIDLVTDGGVKAVRGLVPGSDVSESELEEAVGVEAAEDFRDLAGLWSARIAEYLNVARGLNQQVSENGGVFDFFTNLAKEVRQTEQELEVLREGILNILRT